MFCSKCGKEIDNSNAFCPYCGQPAATQPAVTQPITVQPAVTQPPMEEPPQTAPQQAFQNAPVQQPMPGYVPQYAPQYAPQPAPEKSKKGLILAIVLPCAAVFTVIIVLLASFIIKSSEKAELQEKLLRDWSRVEYNDGVYYTLILDFSEDEIEYNFDSTYIDRQIATYEYEVISGDTIEVENFGEIKITFNDDETMMTFTPSLTDTEYSQNWFDLD